MFGQNLCGQTAAGNWIAPGQLPSTLAGCSVTVNGIPAMMHYVSPGQVNFIVPQNVAPGAAAVTLTNGSMLQTGSMMIAPGAPGVFAFNGMGMGAGAMLHGITFNAGAFSTTTNGQTTPVAIYLTGLDLTTKPSVSIGGMPADVTWFGNAPGFVGLQQININLPANAAGAGRVPVTVTSAGQTSNVTYMTVLPTSAMMQGMPGWGAGMMIPENAPRGRELSYLAVNPANNTALVADANDDAVRVISLDSNTTAATITLPEGSGANAIAVNDAGTLAAVALAAKASVALIDLAQNKAVAVIGTGNYPSHVAFAGASLLVANGASGTVSVVDTTARTIAQTVAVGFGPSGIAVAGNVAVVANTQAGSLSLINLTSYGVTNVPLPPGSRPHEVAIAPALNKAIITTPMSNAFLILDLATQAVTSVPTDFWNAMGPGAVVASGTLAFIANQMTASVTVVDVPAGKVLKTFSVDPGPRALAVNPAKNQLLVLAEGTGTLDLVDLNTYTIAARLNAADTERQGAWALPLISSLAPNAAAAGSAPFTLTITGTNFQAVKALEFELMGMLSGGAGGGMMSGGGMMGSGMGAEDTNIKVSNVQVNSTGTQITATIQVLSGAVAGSRLLRLETDQGEVMAPMFNSLFTVTAK